MSGDELPRRCGNCKHWHCHGYAIMAEWEMRGECKAEVGTYFRVARESDGRDCPRWESGVEEGR